MIRAIARCAMNQSLNQFSDLPMCITLQEACAIIESDPNLNQLKDILVSKIQNYFYCFSCQKPLDKLQLINSQIFIFKLTTKREFVAHPVNTNEKQNLGDNEQFCTYCMHSTKDIVLPLYKQVYHKCPPVLMVSYYTLLFNLFQHENLHACICE